VGFAVLDVQMHFLLHGRNIYNFYHRRKARYSSRCPGRCTTRRTI
jgi:hypothetical protein